MPRPAAGGAILLSELVVRLHRRPNHAREVKAVKVVQTLGAKTTAEEKHGGADGDGRVGGARPRGIHALHELPAIEAHVVSA